MSRDGSMHDKLAQTGRSQMEGSTGVFLCKYFFDQGYIRLWWQHRRKELRLPPQLSLPYLSLLWGQECLVAACLELTFILNPNMCTVTGQILHVLAKILLLPIQMVSFSDVKWHKPLS